MADITQASSGTHIEAIRQLFLEYAQSLGFSLCFQSFEQELASLPGMYAPPAGRLTIAEGRNGPTGCVGLHPLEDNLCEMKRLYVRPAYRGAGLGRLLALRAIAQGRAIGYRGLRLDTVPSVMGRAVELYRKLGFREIAPYRNNPIDGAIYLEIDL